MVRQVVVVDFCPVLVMVRLFRGSLPDANVAYIHPKEMLMVYNASRMREQFIMKKTKM